MDKIFNVENNDMNFVALTSDENSYYTCNNINNSIYHIDCGFNYFGIKSGISYNENEDLSFWEY